MQSAGKLLPPQTHAVLSEAVLEPKGRVIIIGDVHGCVKEMKVRESAQFITHCLSCPLASRHGFLLEEL